jgi:hypothetical protein
MLYRILGPLEVSDGDRVASVDKPGHQPDANRTARSCNENSHRVSRLVTSPASRGSTAMTQPDDRM